MSRLPTIPGSVHDNFHFERELQSRGFDCVAGTDEAGRGPLAGPVVAACVSLPAHCDKASFRDSKALSPKQRSELYTYLLESQACIGVGIVSQKTIDHINILQASLLAMKLAMYNHSANGKRPDFLLVDGTFTVPVDVQQLTLTKGEWKSGSIAAASIVAKVRRDQIMNYAHQRFPQYGFNRNQGYPTKEHRMAVAVHGPCPLHRMSFKGVRDFVR